MNVGVVTLVGAVRRSELVGCVGVERPGELVVYLELRGCIVLVDGIEFVWWKLSPLKVVSGTVPRASVVTSVHDTAIEGAVAGAMKLAGPASPTPAVVPGSRPGHSKPQPTKRTAAPMGVGASVDSGSVMPCDLDGSRVDHCTEDARMFEVPVYNCVIATEPHNKCCCETSVVELNVGYWVTVESEWDPEAEASM